MEGVRTQHKARIINLRVGTQASSRHSFFFFPSSSNAAASATPFQTSNASKSKTLKSSSFYIQSPPIFPSRRASLSFLPKMPAKAVQKTGFLSEFQPNPSPLQASEAEEMLPSEKSVKSRAF